MKRLIIIIVSLLVTIGFLKYGKSIYVPVVKKIKGKETVESILDKIQNNALDRLQLNFDKAGFKDFPREIIIVAFKEEKKLQVYAKHYVGIKFIKEYPFTANSGELVPKLKEGDRQIPEGIYKVEYLNPNSSYYLSIKVNYPNEFDKSKSQLTNVKDMGGDIFIHGKSVTIGCIPIGDLAIEEVFLMTQKAINNEIKVIISPRDFRENDEYPKIKSIDWENELYDKIKAELNTLPNNGYSSMPAIPAHGKFAAS